MSAFLTSRNAPAEDAATLMDSDLSDGNPSVLYVVASAAGHAFTLHFARGRRTDEVLHELGEIEITTSCLTACWTLIATELGIMVDTRCDVSPASHLELDGPAAPLRQ